MKANCKRSRESPFTTDMRKWRGQNYVKFSVKFCSSQTHGTCRGKRRSVLPVVADLG
jgi:hypothetical protein